MKMKWKLIFLSVLFCGTLTVINAMTPTWKNGAKFSRGVNNVAYWISSSASPYSNNIYGAVHNWMYTGYGNPIYMNEVSSNYATHIDYYVKTPKQDSTLDGIAGYASFWNSSGGLMATRGYGPSSNCFYTEVTINKNDFPSAYRTSIVIHEMGHCFGLKHSDSKYSIMYPYYDTTKVSTVQRVDNDTIKYLY